MWLSLLFSLVILLFTAVLCGKKKDKNLTTKKEENSSNTKPLPKVSELKKPEGSVASDVELKQPESNPTARKAVAPTKSSTAVTEEVKPPPPQEKTPKFAVEEATQPSSRISLKQVKKPSTVNLVRNKMSKELTKKTMEDSKAQNDQQKPDSSADDSDTFKHVMSIRDVVKKDKEMKQKQMQKST